MSTALEIHHIGEPLLCALLSHIAAEGRLGALACVRHRECDLGSVTKANGTGTPTSFLPNVKLKPVQVAGTTYLFDGAHQVDILAVGAASSAFPIEAKLGVDRLSPAEFTKRFLLPVGLSKHSPPRVTGSMVALLMGGGAAPLGTTPLQAAIPGAPHLSTAWGLVIRAGTWAKWRMSEPPIGPNGHIFIFEQIASSYGPPADFDTLVHQVVGRDFFSSWGLAPHAG